MNDKFIQGISIDWDKIGYDSHSELCDAIRLAKGYRKPGWGYFHRAESFYNVATKEQEYADAVHPSERLHEKSHGESFLAIAQRHFSDFGNRFNAN